MGAAILLNKSLRKFVAIALITVMACLSINTIFSVAHEVEEAGFTSPHAISIGFLHLNTAGHCPSCPTDGHHPSTDHDHFSCDHHTYMSLATQIDYSHPLILSLSVVSVEPFQFIPEVFSTIDTPPHIHA